MKKKLPEAILQFVNQQETIPVSLGADHLRRGAFAAGPGLPGHGRTAGPPPPRQLFLCEQGYAYFIRHTKGGAGYFDV